MESSVFPLAVYIYIYIYILIGNARVRLFGHLIASLSFMLHMEQSSGNCQKKRLQSKVFENTEQYTIEAKFVT